MTLMLGAYSKNNCINIKEFHHVLNDFSLEGKREIQTEVQDKIFFASALNNGSINIQKNEDGNLLILFSGNLYDYKRHVKELVKTGHTFHNTYCEAEFILHAYEEYGDSFLNNLNGSFTFAIYNIISNELTIANDCFGIWPLFIFDSNKYLIFSTEYQSLAAYINKSNPLDFDSIAEFYTLGLPLGDKTFIKGVSNLPPGTVMKVSPKGSDVRHYHNLSIGIDRGRKIHYYTEALADSIKKAVSIRVEGSKNKVVRLTGGADTRLILSNIPKEKRRDLIFQTVKSPFLSENEDRDVIIAKIIADRAKLNHNVLSPLGEVYDSQERFGSKFFRDRREIPLDQPLGGWHGSQFLGGICFFMAPILQRDISKIRIQVRLRRIFSRKFLLNISNPYDSLRKILGNLEAENDELLFIIHQLTRGFFTSIFKGTRSGWNDPYSFPTRFETVFWDKGFLETILAIPKKVLFDYNLYNQLFKNHFPEFIDVPTNSPLAKRSDSCMPRMEEGIEPKDVRRPKYLTALRNYLKSPDSWQKGFYNRKFRLEMLVRAASNKAVLLSPVENHKLVASFIDFEAWHRNYFAN